MTYLGGGFLFHKGFDDFCPEPWGNIIHFQQNCPLGVDKDFDRVVF